MADVELFWDPVCPFAWITSRWVVEVAEQRHLDVRWLPISLRILNEDRYESDDELAAKQEGHRFGLELLRVAVAVDADHGNDAVGRLYTALGRAIHLGGDAKDLIAGGARPVAEQALAQCELPAELAAATADESRDAAIRADTEVAMQRTGGDTGTPILTFGPPDGPSFFGPVISRVPRGPEAVTLWEAVETIARHSWFAELKRSLREPPEVDS